MAITRPPVHCRRAFVLSVALTLAACSSSSTNNDSAQGGSGGAASAKSGGSTAGVDAAVASTGGSIASAGGSTVSSGGTTSLGGSTAVTSTGGAAASSGTVAIRVPGLGAAGFNYTQGSYITGFVFRANRAISITQFGYYDSNLTGGAETFQPHSVGVYDLSTHTLLGSATVQPSDPVTGLFHYVSLTNPIAVNTTDTYAIVGVTGTNKYTVGITASEAPVNAALTYVSGAGYGPSNNNATMTSTLVEPNAFDAGNIFGQPVPTGTLCDFGPNFMFVTNSGGGDAGVDAPVTSPGDAAAGSDGATAKPDGAIGSDGSTVYVDSTSLLGSSGDDGAVCVLGDGGSGNLCNGVCVDTQQCRPGY